MGGGRGEGEARRSHVGASQAITRSKPYRQITANYWIALQSFYNFFTSRYYISIKPFFVIKLLMIRFHFLGGRAVSAMLMTQCN